jgi:arginyl-tRNA synthetase
LTDNYEYTNERMALLKAIKIVINNSLNLIGIIPREEM